MHCVLPEDVNRVSVLGTGTIGASWVTLFLARGFEVHAYDAAADAESRVHAFVERAWRALERLNLTAKGDRTKLVFHRKALDAVQDTQFVQESVPEDIQTKHKLYRLIEPAIGPDVVVATTASGLLVRELQEAFQRPHRFLVAHPFNPPHLLPLVELLGGDHTSPDALKWAELFYRHCGKVTITLRKEVPGFVANRLQAALWREAIHLVADGVASVEDIDTAVVYGPGMRWAIMGPHMLFSLSTGGGGMQVFCDRYRDSFHRWWQDLGQPDLRPEVVAALVNGVHEEEGGRSYDALVRERDDKLVALLAVLGEARRP